MDSIKINLKDIELVLTQARGKIRIADFNGNHIRKPTTEGKNIKSNYIEWMITNKEVGNILNKFLNKLEKINLKNNLKKLSKFIRNTKYATRKSVKITSKKIDLFEKFEVYQYTDIFYSFEKKISSKIKVRVIFKMGDYTLAPHMFILIPFYHKSLKLKNFLGNVAENEALGSKCKGFWTINKEDIFEIVEALAYSSKDHRDDLIKIIDSQI